VPKTTDLALLVLAASALLPAAGCYRQTVLESDELTLVRRAAPLSKEATLLGPDGLPRVSPGAYVQFQRTDGTCTSVLYANDLHFNDVGVFYDNPDIGQDDVSHAYVSGLTPEDHVRLLERAPAGCAMRDDSPDAELVLVCPERMQQWLSDYVTITPEEGDPYQAWVTQKFSGEWVFEIEGFRLPPRRGDDLAIRGYSRYRSDKLYESMAWADVERARVFNYDTLRSAASIIVLPVGLAGLLTNTVGATDLTPAPDGLDWECAEEPFEANGSALKLQKKGQVFLPDEGSTKLVAKEDHDAFHATFFASFDFGLNPLAQDSIAGSATAGVRTLDMLDVELGARHTLAAGLGEAANSYTHVIVRAGLNLNIDPDRVLALFLGWEGGLGTSPLNAGRWGLRWRPVEDFTVALYPFNPTSVLRLDQNGETIRGDWRTMWVSSAGLIWEF
jgi:hypothetical protein